MRRTASIGLRVELAVKEAAERAAADDNRSLSSLVEKLIVEFLRRRGYLPDPVLGWMPENKEPRL